MVHVATINVKCRLAMLTNTTHAMVRAQAGQDAGVIGFVYAMQSASIAALALIIKTNHVLDGSKIANVINSASTARVLHVVGVLAFVEDTRTWIVTEQIWAVNAIQSQNLNALVVQVAIIAAHAAKERTIKTIALHANVTKNVHARHVVLVNALAENTLVRLAMELMD